MARPFGRGSELGFDTRDYSAAPESRDKIEQAVVAVPRHYQPSEAARFVVYNPITGFATKPFEHQQRGLCELIDNDTWALFWKMGTGKSAAIVYRLVVGFYRNEFSRVLVLCPFGVIDTWLEQLKTHGPLTGCRFGGNPRARDAQADKYFGAERKPLVIVSNYELLLKESKRLAAAKFDVVIGDEAHRFCNIATQTYKRLKLVAAKARYRWALTGTPMPNNPLNILGIANFIDPKILDCHSKKNFEHRHAEYGRFVAPHIREIIGYRNLDQLGRAVGSFSSYVTKDVCPDLPSKTITPLYCELSDKQKTIYRKLKKDAVAELVSKRGKGELTINHVIAQQLRLLQVTGGFVPDDDKVIHPIEPNGKLGALRDSLEDALLENGQIIIWTAFVAEARAICAMLFSMKVTAALHIGAMDAQQRCDALTPFKAGDVRALVATSSSTREGLTLVQASRAWFYSRTHQLLDWLQTQDRIHRIGQKDAVTIYPMIAKRTVDVAVDQSLNKKEGLQEMLAGGAPVEELLGPDPF